MHDVSRGSGPTDEFFYIVWNFHARGTKRLISIEFFQAWRVTLPRICYDVELGGC